MAGYAFIRRICELTCLSCHQLVPQHVNDGTAITVMVTGGACLNQPNLTGWLQCVRAVLIPAAEAKEAGRSHDMLAGPVSVLQRFPDCIKRAYPTAGLHSGVNAADSPSRKTSGADANRSGGKHVEPSLNRKTSFSRSAAPCGPPLPPTRAFPAQGCPYIGMAQSQRHPAAAPRRNS